MADLSNSKTLIAAGQGDHSPHWYGIPVRVFFLTFIGTLLSFAISLLLAILGTVIVATLRGVHADMRTAYWHIALPMALVAGVVIFVLATILEIRHYQQRKTLTAIEKMN